MKNLAIIFLSTIMISSASLADKAKVVATYSGKDVTDTQIMAQFGPMLDSQPQNQGKSFSELDPKLQAMLIKGYISQDLVTKEAIKQGIKDKPEFKENLKNKLEAVESQILQQELISSYLKTAVTDKMVDEKYAQLANEVKGQKEVKTSHILVGTEEEANELKKKLNKGAKFETLAKDFSKDEGSKVKGGELGYARKGQFVPEFESKAFAMKVGEISDPVKSQFGWHIIKLIDSRDVQIPPKAEVKDEIKARLSQEAIDTYVSKLYKDANVELKINTTPAETK
jgi:parvulin-like peptidyl-prolyl isomerase